MICAPIDTDKPRFTVLTVTGFPIHPSGATKDRKPILSATVFDRFYMREIRTFRSSDRRPPAVLPLMGTERGRVCGCGRPKAPQAHTCRTCLRESGWFRTRWLGFEGALAAAADRCAELNAWHEREGWDE
jgi:hypothetical protein